MAKRRPTARPYTGPMQWGPEKSLYYIHIHQQNVGKAENGRYRKLATELSGQKKQAFTAAKKYYKTLFTNSLSPEARTLLGEALEEDDVMTELDRQLTKALETFIDSPKLHALLATQTEVAEKNLAADIAKRGRPAIEAYNRLLETLAKCCEMIGSKDGAALGALLLAERHSTEGNRFLAVSSGKSLRRALTQFRAENEKKTVEQKALDHVAKKINEFAKHLIEHRKETGKKLTEKGVQGVIDKIIFSQGFAEALSGIAKKTALKAVDKMEVDYIGDNRGKVMLTDSAGNKIGFDSTTTKSEGKADVHLSNFSVTFGETTSHSYGELSLEVGLSTKSYRTNSFGVLDGKQSYSSGSGGTLKEALTAVFGSDVRSMYLAYNVFTFSSYYQNEIKVLNDLILTRQLVRLFSSRSGEQDFAQYIIANGELVSVWQLLLETEKFVGLSNSMGGASQMVSLTIPGRSDIEKLADATFLSRYDRVKAINSKIDSTKIYANLHVGNLSNAASKN